MRRIQFIEIHDQPWCPSSIRDGLTDSLQFGMNLVNPYESVVPLLRSVLDSLQKESNSVISKSGSSRIQQSIVDMCSGGGGPWLSLAREFESREARADPTSLHIWLTDKYPNHRAFRNPCSASGNCITFYPHSVDATQVPPELKGTRTMFTSFHHFSPERARAILQNAVDAREGIAIFESTRRAPATIALMAAWVFMLFVCSPWMRPFRWSRLLWMYLIPILPVVLLFDGVVSCLRTYRPEELRQLVKGLNPNDYEWKMERIAPERRLSPICLASRADPLPN